MSIDQILQTVNGSTIGADRLLQVDSDAQFRNTLTIGQIIKGKVLRHYEGSKYLVDFNGQEKVVDSRMTLIEGSTIRGRVTAIADKVMLQRVVDAEVMPSLQRGNQVSVKEDSDLLQLKQLLASVNVELSSTQLTDLLKLIRVSGDRQLSLMASMLLLKNGLGMTKNGLAIAQEALKEGKLKLPNELLEYGARIVLNNERQYTTPDNAIQVLAEYLRNVLVSKWHANINKIAKAKNNESDADKDYTTEADSELLISEHVSNHQYFPTTTWLMNAQVDGSVAHKTATLPLWVGGKIIEFDVAVFSQNEHNSVAMTDTKYQKVVLSLETINMGRVNIIAQLINTHLKLSVTGEDKGKVIALSEYSSDLHERLSESNWIVDEIKYKENIDNNNYAPAMVVADHIIKQDSLSRLM